MEAVVRAAYVKYLNDSKGGNLANKLLKLFQERLVPFATKSPCKTEEEELQYSVGEVVCKQYISQLKPLFQSHALKKECVNYEFADYTISVNTLMQLCQQMDLFTPLFTLDQFLLVVEKFYDPADKLATILNVFYF
jgi:hypothetical protein